MKRILIAILTALTLLAGWTPTPHAADRTPLLMEGKKTLYQRVITHPGTSLYAGQGEGSTVIQKDTDMAGDCYKKALAAGAAEAQQRLDALK